LPKRRYISEDVLSDEHFNSISDGAQSFWYRLLAISDDYGFVPMDPFKMQKLTCLSEKKTRKMIDWLAEILKAKLGRVGRYENEQYFLFKSRTFDLIQTHIVAKRTRSEYLGVKKPLIEEIRKSIEKRPFPEDSGNSMTFFPPKGERRKEKEEGESVREGTIEPSTPTNLLLQLVTKSFPSVASMSKPMTQAEANKLMDKFPWEVTTEVLEAMENHAGLHKKYVSAYLTAKNWCERRMRNPKETPHVTRTTYCKLHGCSEPCPLCPPRPTAISKALEISQTEREGGK
jgi:hypothetical protein